MSAPSGKIPLPPEAYAALGDFRSAIRELKKAQSELEQTAAQVVAAQGKIDPALRARIDQTKARVEYYREQEVNRKTAAAEAKKSTAKTIAGLLNTHNPHGALRSLLSGASSTGPTVANLAGTVGQQLQNFGTKMGSIRTAALGTQLVNTAASVAGPAALAGFIAHFIARHLETVEAKHEQNSAREKQLASESLAFTRQFRMGGHFSAADLTERRRRIQAAESLGSSGAASLYDLVPFLGSPDARARGLEFGALEARRFKAEHELKKLVGEKEAKRLLDPKQYETDKDVLYKATDYRSIGTLEWLKRRAAEPGLSDLLSGTLLVKMLLPNYDKKAVEEEAQRRAAKAGEDKLRQFDEFTRAWMEQPVNRTIVAQHERHLRAVETFEVERFGNWSPY